MNGRRILITGITGFVGSHLTRALEAAGAVVTGLSTDAVPAVAGARAEVLHADLLEPAALAAVIARADPETIVHLGGLSHVGESWQRPGDYLRVNFVGTCNLFAVAAGRRVLFASSGEVYGPVPEAEQPIREERPLDPRSPYAMTKACAETVALDHGGIVVRSFNAIGPGQSPHFALPSFARQLTAIAHGEKSPVLEVGDLTPRRDFLHVADAAAGYLRLVADGIPGTVYNLASGQAISIAEALARLQRIAGVDARLECDPTRVRPNDVPVLYGDNRRLRQLGWQPEREVDAALAELWHEAGAARHGGSR